MKTSIIDKFATGMKLALCGGMLCLLGCEDIAQDSNYKEDHTKKVMMKESSVEQRMGVDFFSEEMFRQRTTTVYYLIAEDGMVAEVGLTDYAKTKIGDDYYSMSWHVKN